MKSEFYSLLTKALRNSKTNSIGTVDEFYETSKLARRLILKIYQQNPSATREEVDQQMQEMIQEILAKTIEIRDFKSNILRKNAIKYVFEHWDKLQDEYNKVIEEEKTTGKKLEVTETIVYSPNKKIAVTQLLKEIIVNIRDVVSDVDENVRRAIKAGDAKVVKKWLMNGNTSRETRESAVHIVKIFKAKNEFERVKYYLEKIVNREITDKEVKEDYINAIICLGEMIDKFDVLNTYVSQQNREFARLGLEIEQTPEDIVSMFERENLEKLSLPELVALYSFWDNRLVKETITIYRSYFIMHELCIDDREKLESGNFSITEDEFETLNLKINLICLKIDEIHKKYREITFGGKKISISKEIKELEQQIGEEYNRYFSNVGGVKTHKNNFTDDFVQYLGLENARKNLYGQKDNSIIGLLDLLYNNNISENWGIIEENKKSNYVLVAADIAGLNMPLRLHIRKDLLMKFVQRNQGNTIIPIYSGGDDFIVGGRYIATHSLVALTQEQSKKIHETSANMRDTDYRAKFVRHINFLANPQEYPEHLQRKRTVMKKGKQKVKAERIKDYIDLTTGQKYHKEKNGDFVPDNSQGR